MPSRVVTNAGAQWERWIRAFLEERGIRVNAGINAYQLGTNSLDVDDLLSDLLVNFEVYVKDSLDPEADEERLRLGKELAAAHLNNLRNKERARLVSELQKRLEFRASDRDLAREWLRALVHPDIQGDHFEDNLAVFKHWLWLVKRSVYGESRSYIMMPIFYGEGGSGKSEAIVKLLGYLGDFQRKETFSVLKGDFNPIRLHYTFAVFLDEMADLSPELGASLKAALDDGNVAGRKMRVQDGINKRMNSMMIATTNSAPPHGLPADAGARRFASLRCRDRITTLPHTIRQPLYDFINNFNYEALWRSIDHNATPPISERIGSVQERSSAETTTASTLFEFIHDDTWCTFDAAAVTPMAAFRTEYMVYALEANEKKSWSLQALYRAISDMHIPGLKLTTTGRTYPIAGLRLTRHR